MTRQHLTEDQIQRMIASDPDAPEATEDQLAQARPFTEAFPALAEAMKPLDRLQALASELHAESMRDHSIKQKLDGMGGKATEDKAQKLVKAGKIEEARHLLANTSLDIQAIALEVGFTSGANFATAFRERFGMSPSAFRRDRPVQD